MFTIYNQRARGARAGKMQDRNKAEFSVFGRKAAQCRKDIIFAYLYYNIK